jgi:hypothetical protein
MDDGVSRGLVTVVVGIESDFPNYFRYKYINESPVFSQTATKDWQITDLGFKTQRFYGIFYINNIGWIIGGDLKIHFY